MTFGKEDLPDEIKEMLAKIDEDVRTLNQKRKDAGLDKIPPEATDELRKSMDATFRDHPDAFIDEVVRRAKETDFIAFKDEEHTATPWKPDYASEREKGEQ